jgi:hypothetical protein
MRTLTESIDIGTSRAAVWSVLTDVSAYRAWNPLLRCEGPFREGARLRVRVKLPGLPAIYTRPRVVSVVPARELRWRTRFPGVCATHAFLLEERSDRTRFVQTERFEGPLADPFVDRFGRASARGFEQMNHDLRRRTERMGAD